MEPPSPARLYAAAVGAFLVLVGILGFFYTASFGSPGSVEHELGALRVNGWLNVLHIATGALGLLLAGAAARRYSLAMGALYTVLAIWGWALGPGDAILGFLPASGGDEALHLVLGLLGLGAAAGTPRAEPRAKRPRRRAGRRGSKRRRSESRAKVAGDRP
jgi:uncharacterized protein DUF4383